MIEAIGWLTVAAVGAYWLGAIAVAVTSGNGGLESLPRAFVTGVVVAVGWVAFVAWLSPLAITFQ